MYKPSFHEHPPAKVYKPFFHEHPLFSSAKFVTTDCGACKANETIYGGYYCKDLDCNGLFFHKKCIEAPLEINHPSHPQHHPLLLTSGDFGDDPCDLCGIKIKSPFYSCYTCGFKVDLFCWRKPSPSAIEHPPCHDHPLALLKIQIHGTLTCAVCMGNIWGQSYICRQCNLYFHLDCVDLSKEVNHPCHSNHPIKLIVSRKLMHDAEKICFACKTQPEEVIYHCSICNFSICLDCTRNPPPLLIEHSRTHIHPLALFSRKMLFTCDVCGEEGKEGPYVCLQCAFLIHRECIDSPRIININRHDYRISFTHHLGAGYSKCGVCRKSLSRYHGAYSCSVCPEYAVHCRCAVSYGVWDGAELEGMPNHDDTEYIIAPFKLVGDDLINHFSHKKHPLKLYKDNILYDKWLECDACILSLGLESVYVCDECGFFLHEKCANIPMRKRLIFSASPFELEVVNEVVSNCSQCGVLFDGFMYTSGGSLKTDVHCGSLCEPFIRDDHLHPLYFDTRRVSCDACKDFAHSNTLLRCDACNFNLCLYCASLPLKIWHKNDDHPITLHYGVKEDSLKSWCDICERELDQCTWFYTCTDCEVTFHTRCLLGDFSRLKPKKLIFYFERRLEVVRNNNNTRPLCSQCHSRCKVSIVLKVCDGDNGYICSLSCFVKYWEVSAIHHR